MARLRAVILTCKCKLTTVLARYRTRYGHEGGIEGLNAYLQTKFVRHLG